MKKLLLVTILLANSLTFAQVQSNQAVPSYWNAKEWSKDIALFCAKQFLFGSVIGSSSQVVRMNIEPLAAASSGELTSLLYKCPEKNKDGLILGFFGFYANSNGVQGFSFKNFSTDKAIEFMNKIDQAMSDNISFLKDDNDNNNVFFTFEDIDVLISRDMSGNKIRLFWNGFDSTWEGTAFDRTKKRFERKSNK